MQNPGAVECGEAATLPPAESHPSDEKLLDPPRLFDDIPLKGSGSDNSRELYSSGVEKSPPKSTLLDELELEDDVDSRLDPNLEDEVRSRQDSKDSRGLCSSE